MPAERLQKIIAAAGIASRRKSEELITAGQVQVNGQVVTELGTKADPEQDHIRVNGKVAARAGAFHLCRAQQAQGYVDHGERRQKAPTVMDLVSKVKGRVYPVAGSIGRAKACS